MNKGIALILAVLFTVFPWHLAWSQTQKDGPKKSFGPRIGYGTEPDQFVIGAQAVLGRTLGFMRFAPSVDLGLGDDLTTLLFNADLRVLSFSPPGSAAGLYGGVGAALAVLDHKNDGSDTEVGINGVIGLTFPLGRKHLYSFETRLGTADIPHFRILFGVMLGGQSQPARKAIEIRR